MITLRPGLSFCDVGPQLVFLDLVADQYFCLSEAGEASFRSLLSQSELIDKNEAVQSLLAAGVIVEHASGPPLAPSRQPTPATLSLIDRPIPRAKASATAVAIAALLTARLRLRVLGIRREIGLLRARKSRMTERTAQLDLGHAMAGFVSASRWLTARDACLSHSIAVARSLIGAGVSIELVIGVRLGPFAAHCWVQHHECVINDRVDFVRTFTPILAV